MKPCNAPTSAPSPGGAAPLPPTPSRVLDALACAVGARAGLEGSPLTTERLAQFLTREGCGTQLAARAWEALNLVLFGTDWPEPSEALSEWLERAPPREVSRAMEDAACAAGLLAVLQVLHAVPSQPLTEARVGDLLDAEGLQRLSLTVWARLGVAVLGEDAPAGASLEPWLQHATPEALAEVFTRAARLRAQAPSSMPNPTAAAALESLATHSKARRAGESRRFSAGELTRLLREVGASDATVREAFEALCVVLLGEVVPPPFPGVTRWLAESTHGQILLALADASIAAALLALPRVLAERPPVRLTFEELDTFLSELGVGSAGASRLYTRLRVAALGSPAPNPQGLEAWLREASAEQLSTTLAQVARMRR